jgi:ribosomal protein S18 acetylase RimI-like enzyme
LTALRPLSALTPEERSWLAEFIADQPILSLYFEAALEDLAKGLDNRLVLIGRRRRGLILGIAFDASDAFTVFGALEDAELNSVVVRPRRAEVHVGPAIADQARALCGSRVANVFGMRIYTRATDRNASTDSRCRRLTLDDLADTTRFYNAHYPQTVFSGWMLERPFLALFAGRRMVAAAGVLAMSDRRRWAIIGNFLTDPAWRGQGLAKIVGRGLVSLLNAEGIEHVALVTTDENQAACRVYEGLGFGLAERWVQIDLEPVN